MIFQHIVESLLSPSSWYCQWSQDQSVYESPRKRGLNAYSTLGYSLTGNIRYLCEIRGCLHNINRGIAEESPLTRVAVQVDHSVETPAFIGRMLPKP